MREAIGKQDIGPLSALEGCKRLVFDADAWEQAGGDIGDNSCFWKPATIVKVRRSEGEWVADIVFDHDMRVSHGHFVNSLREVQ